MVGIKMIVVNSVILVIGGFGVFKEYMKCYCLDLVDYKMIN